ncbi:hypothetical protein [Microbulbifer rhizosphaerae]|uniref:hypothetical protein n=1 Tax=Microbulbifer rhizosphaerae TaxID=1562603 RepID=UPI0016142ECF
MAYRSLTGRVRFFDPNFGEYNFNSSGGEVGNKGALLVQGAVLVLVVLDREFVTAPAAVRKRGPPVSSPEVKLRQASYWLVPATWVIRSPSAQPLWVPRR